MGNLSPERARVVEQWIERGKEWERKGGRLARHGLDEVTRDAAFVQGCFKGSRIYLRHWQVIWCRKIIAFLRDNELIPPGPVETPPLPLAKTRRARGRVKAPARAANLVEILMTVMETSQDSKFQAASTVQAAACRALMHVMECDLGLDALIDTALTRLIGLTLDTDGSDRYIRSYASELVNALREEMYEEQFIEVLFKCINLEAWEDFHNTKKRDDQMMKTRVFIAQGGLQQLAKLLNSSDTAVIVALEQGMMMIIVSLVEHYSPEIRSHVVMVIDSILAHTAGLEAVLDEVELLAKLKVMGAADPSHIVRSSVLEILGELAEEDADHMGTGATHMQDDPEWRNDAWDVINRGEVQVAPQEVQVPKVISLEVEGQAAVPWGPKGVRKGGHGVDAMFGPGLNIPPPAGDEGRRLPPVPYAPSWVKEGLYGKYAARGPYGLDYDRPATVGFGDRIMLNPASLAAQQQQQPRGVTR